MAKARAHPTTLDALIELPLITEGLYELRERAEQDGDRATAPLTDDAIEALLALLDRIEFRRRTAPVRDVG